MHPHAYIRRSVASRSDPGDISREFQIEAVRGLAGEDASQLQIIDADWGRSAATDKTTRRLAFLGLLDKIEQSEVSALYAYSTDRLARSVEWSARLLNACRRANVPIVTREGTIAPGDAAAALLFNVLAAVNENALSGMEAKARASVQRRQARNLEQGLPANAGMGQQPYGTGPGESIQTILETFAEVGSFAGTAKHLNANGVPTRRGGRWDIRTVARIVRVNSQLAPDPHPSRRGVRAQPAHLFSRLLRCHCEAILTTTPRANGTVRYYCRTAHLDPTHSRPYIVEETKIREWAMAQTRKTTMILQTSETISLGGPSPETIAAQRAAILDLAEDLTITPQEARERLRRLDEASQTASTATRAVRRLLQGVDWDLSIPEINTGLHAIWRHIQLGPDMLPINADWYVDPSRSDS